MFIDWIELFLFTGDMLIGRFHMMPTEELPMDGMAQ